MINKEQSDGKYLSAEVFNLWRRFLISNDFPVDDPKEQIFAFKESLWQHWIDSIENIKKLQYSASLDWDPLTGEINGYECPEEEYIKSDALNSIQGAMFVFMWSRMEKFFKAILPYLCVLNTPNAKLSDAYKLYKDQFVQPILYPKLIKLFRLYRLNFIREKYSPPKKRITFQFPMFKKAYQKIDKNGVGSIKHFTDINDIRLLNNIFKHMDGNYSYTNSECQKLSNSIKKKLNIDSDSGCRRLEYQKLDPKEYVEFCNLFVNDVLDKVYNQLKKRGYLDKSHDL